MTALAHLYSRYRQRLIRFCLRLLNDKQSAEDTVQNVFLKLQAEHGTIRNTGSLKSWLFTVARNEVFGELRRKSGLEPDDELVWNGDLPDEELAKRDRNERITLVLNSLYPAFREVIMLREYEQLSYEEIAQVTGSSIASVKSRLFKARKSMITKLRPFLEEK